MQRYRFGGDRVRPDAAIGFVIGVVVAYVLQVRVPGVRDALAILGTWGTALIVVAVGGLWYWWRKVV